MISLYDKLPQGGEGYVEEEDLFFSLSLALLLPFFLSLAPVAMLIHLMGEVRGQIFQLTQSDRAHRHFGCRYKNTDTYTDSDTNIHTTRCENKHSLLHFLNFIKISASSFFQFSIFFGTCTGFCVFLFMINFHNFRLSEFSTKRYSIHTYLTCCGCTRF